MKFIAFFVIVVACHLLFIAFGQVATSERKQEQLYIWNQHPHSDTRGQGYDTVGGVACSLIGHFISSSLSFLLMLINILVKALSIFRNIENLITFAIVCWICWPGLKEITSLSHLHLRHDMVSLVIYLTCLDIFCMWSQNRSCWFRASLNLI